MMCVDDRLIINIKTKPPNFTQFLCISSLNLISDVQISQHDGIRHMMRAYCIYYMITLEGEREKCDLN